MTHYLTPASRRGGSPLGAACCALPASVCRACTAGIAGKKAGFRPRAGVMLRETGNSPGISEHVRTLSSRVSLSDAAAWREAMRANRGACFLLDAVDPLLAPLVAHAYVRSGRQRPKKWVLEAAPTP